MVMQLRRYLAVLWLALAIVMSTGLTAVQAHAGLMSSSPEEGEILKTNPGQISLRFTETLEPDLITIRLYDWTGEEIKLDKPSLQPGDAAQLNAPLPELPEGTYTAVVAVVSSDGHPVEERLSFSIGQKSASVVQPSEKKQDHSYLIVYRYLAQGIILLGGGLYLISWRGNRFGLPAFGEILGIGRQIGWALALVGLVFLWFLYDESLPAVSLTEALWQGNGTLLSQSPFAVMLIASFALLLLLVIPNMISGWYVSIWILLVSAQAFGGHAWGISPVWLAIALRLLHVLAVSLWLGALAYLLLVMKKAEQGQKAFKAFFLRTVAVAALLAVVTGFLMMVVQTDVASILQSSNPWSYLLYAKAALVGVMLAFAFRQTKRWREKNRLQPKLLRWELLLGILAVLMGLWMSQIPYPTAVAPDQTTIQTRTF